MNENKEIVQRFFARLSDGAIEEACEALSVDVVNHDMPLGLPSGREGAKQLFTLLQASFRPLRYDVLDLVAEGDKVAARFQVTGKHEGTFLSVAATGNPVAYQVIDIFRFDQGKIVERWGVADLYGALNQLGAFPR